MRPFLFAIAFAGLLASQSPVPGSAQAPGGASSKPPAMRDAGAVDVAKAAAIAALQSRLEQGKATVASVLADRANDELRDKTPFRELIKKYASTAAVTMVAKDEPGAPLVVDGRVDDDQGKPIADAMVYAYHTDARGFYGYERAHVGGDGGDFKHARLFAYARTDRNGAFVLHTIRPASYPDTDLPQHIHFEVTAKGKATLVTEILFADDPKLDHATTQNAKRNGYPVVDVVADKVGPQRCKAMLVLKPAARELGK
jgi:protocatechuate 3,4-dioxygenase beta subunit